YLYYEHCKMSPICYRNPEVVHAEGLFYYSRVYLQGKLLFMPPPAKKKIAFCRYLFIIGANAQTI
ncbi:MAG: hypothetical protein NTV06_03900, partial [candidate division Zixibacteria bacterium]|nr:hypothetical protein [candidate division Zixibacteria bacterium]